ncbi:unnamed protein product [Urochloa decumbens]|uniref:Protein kinase domain-containing protein n=1 Tax=Urochloa decumbens TaxID=240449 RepID=A0ABC8WKZ1_9POAL
MLRRYGRSTTIVTLLAAALGLVLAVDGQKIGLPNCPTICGGVKVPYPFGIVPGCHLLGFDLTCNTSYNSTPRLFLWGDDGLQVTDISHDDSTLLLFAPEVMAGRPPNNDSSSSSKLSNFAAPASLFIAKQQLMQWKLLSSALQGSNETRPGNATCPRDLSLGSTALCHSSYSTCQATTLSDSDSDSDPDIPRNISGYTCKCHDGYQGNAYLTDGCQISMSARFRINASAIAQIYLETFCGCPTGTMGDPYSRNGCINPRARVSNLGLIIGLGVGSGAMFFLLVLSTTFMIHRIMTRKKRMRQKFFKQNRGQLLQQLVCQRADISERMILTLEELEKATNNFDKAREVGGGGHGTVYKGILSSLHVVAIKKSKIVIQREIDEFINEVVILSQIRHRNVVKLHGCCLETEVPLLVYEFISNGTLYNHLHVEALVSLPWKDRVRIAVETARALAYLHSLVLMPIIHRDIKSPNILLDDNLTVKLSDFGASRYIPIDQTGLDTTVQGTFGYLDPMYHSTGHLTEKSDVYSFGVILIELLTRKKPVTYRSLEGHGLVNHFVTLLSEGNLVCILDPQVIKEAGGEVIDIALLAAMCVKPISKERPTMRLVEMTLESIHAAKEYASSDITEESEENYVGVNDMSIGGTSEDTVQGGIEH